ncbi:hypothetical protein C8Q75DRAFT_764884 [Abortiporus biennis]|nr:hypothetical protein C8Q75DRAFT_764884 [Abortiporus biennis]
MSEQAHSERSTWQSSFENVLGSVGSAVKHVAHEVGETLKDVDTEAIVGGMVASAAVGAQKLAEGASKIDLRPALDKLPEIASTAQDGFTHLDPTAQKAIIAGGAAVVGFTLAPAVVAGTLGMVGFSSAGVVAGSIAASVQAGVGNVVAGSVFAGAQSVAMGGAAASVVNTAVGGGLAAISYLTGRGFVKDEHANKEEP